MKGSIVQRMVEDRILRSSWRKEPLKKTKGQWTLLIIYAILHSIQDWRTERRGIRRVV